MMFSKPDYERLHSLVFRPDYPGYRPTVAEVPNGDGKADSTKRYAHVALKYLETDEQRRNLGPFLELAHDKAIRVGAALGLPEKYMPKLEYGALRVLEYPPGTSGHRHTDFDLFTLMMFRDQPDRFVAEHVGITALLAIDPMAHLGEIAEILGLGPATAHEILASDTTQHSVVYFAIPDHDSVLPNGVTVREFLDERLARSRVSRS